MAILMQEGFVTPYQFNTLKHGSCGWTFFGSKLHVTDDTPAMWRAATKNTSITWWRPSQNMRVLLFHDQKSDGYYESFAVHVHDPDEQQAIYTMAILECEERSIWRYFYRKFGVVQEGEQLCDLRS